MATHDINYACKHDFHDLQHSSRLRNRTLIVMIFQPFPFDVEFITV